MQTIYLLICEFILLLITFTYKYIIIMLICYVSIKLLRQTCLLISSNCCVYRAAAGTFVNDFTWTHCASCVFNTARFICMLLLIGLTFLTHPPNKRKQFSTLLHTVVHRFQETCRSTIAKRCELEHVPGKIKH